MKGQTGVEYLLMIGGVLLVALVIGSLLTSAAVRVYNSVNTGGTTLYFSGEKDRVAVWDDANHLGYADFLQVSGGTLTVSGDVTAGTVSVGELCINGVCKTSWPSGSSGSSVWDVNGSDIYYTGGRVGIGTSSPQYVLDVKGNVRFNGDVNFGEDPETIHVGRYTKIIAEPRNAAGDRDIWFQSTIWLANKAPSGWQGGTLVLSAQPPHDYKLEDGTVTPSNVYNKTWVLSYDMGNNDLVLYANKGTGNFATTWYNALRWGMNKELNVNADVDVNGTVKAKEICLNGDCKTSWPSGGSGTANCVHITGSYKPDDTPSAVTVTCPPGYVITSACTSSDGGCYSSNKLQYMMNAIFNCHESTSHSCVGKTSCTVSGPGIWCGSGYGYRAGYVAITCCKP